MFPTIAFVLGIKIEFPQAPAGRPFETCPEYEEWKLIFYKAGYTPYTPYSPGD